MYGATGLNTTTSLCSGKISAEVEQKFHMGQLVLAPPPCIDVLLVLVHATVFKIVKKRKNGTSYVAFCQTMPGHHRKWQVLSAAHARAAKACKSEPSTSLSPNLTKIEVLDVETDEEAEAEVTTWPGGVANHKLGDSDNTCSSHEGDLMTE